MTALLVAALALGATASPGYADGVRARLSEPSAIDVAGLPVARLQGARA